MALQPRDFTSQEMLQPGARGGVFVNNDFPGYRGQGDRINRTNNQLDISAHDVLNNKYGLDPRLPSLFRYGWAYGYNQIVIPKGRLVAADPFLMVLDTETMHFFNAVTIANGGKDVILDTDGKTWRELEVGDGVVSKDPADLSETGGYLKLDGVKATNVRPANVPMGLLERNEYTRSVDAYNGIMVGAVHTDCLVELPLFEDADKALANPWGSVIGDIKPGDLVCSNENGYFVKSPLSDPDAVAAMTIAEYEAARRQIVGEVYATDRSLIPEGAARYAQWALSDRMKFNDFNPYEWPQTARDGEDFVTNPPTVYQSDFRFPGYPMERGFLANDLHMLASTRDGMYDPRFDEANRLDRGIPGLTDGFNVVVKAYDSKLGQGDVDLAGEATKKIGVFHAIADAAYLDDPDKFRYLMRLQEKAMEKVRVDLVDETTGTSVANVVLDGPIGRKDTPVMFNGSALFEICYADLHKGLVEINQVAADTQVRDLAIKVSYVKRGQAGVPTNLDWDGVVGTAIILMNK
ncbi:MAG: hypothetical protein ACI3T9_02980 [Romboutsia timonensis]